MTSREMYKINNKNFAQIDKAVDRLNYILGCEIYHLPARTTHICLITLLRENNFKNFIQRLNKKRLENSLPCPNKLGLK